MPVKVVKETIWKKYMTIIRDVVFIIMFLVSVIGWIRAETRSKTKLEDKVESLTKAVENNTKQLEKIDNIISEQNTLNGKIIQYM